MTEKAFKEQAWRGKIGGLDDAEVGSYLNEGVLARLAVIDADGYPYVNPVWFEWDAEEGIFWVIARKKSRWAEYMKNNPKVGMTIDDDRKPLRKVMVQGDAEVVEEEPVEAGAEVEGAAAPAVEVVDLEVAAGGGDAHAVAEPPGAVETEHRHRAGRLARLFDFDRRSALDDDEPGDRGRDVDPGDRK